MPHRIIRPCIFGGVKPHQLIAALMARDGLGALPLAKKMGKPRLQPQIHRFMNGEVKNPARTTALPLAAFFGIPVDAIYDERLASAIAVEKGLATGAVEAPAGVREPKPRPYALEPAGRPRLQRPVPVVGDAKLGQDGYYEQHDAPDGHVDGYSSDPDAYALRVRGDSMHPAIRHGAFVVVEPHGRCVPGEYVALQLVDGRKMVKELVIERPAEIVVESVNGNHRQTIERSLIEHMHPVAAVVAASKWRHAADEQEPESSSLVRGMSLFGELDELPAVPRDRRAGDKR